jgi:hypothetical protein
MTLLESSERTGVEDLALSQVEDDLTEYALNYGQT